MKITKRDVEEVINQDITLVRILFKTVRANIKSTFELCDDKLINWSSKVSDRRKPSKDGVDRVPDKQSGE